MKKRIPLVAMIAAAMGGIAVPATAAVEVYINSAPPALRMENVPPPRHGYVWIPGYWTSHGHKYVWAKGTWAHAHPGYQYHGSQWVEHDGRWTMQHGRWSRYDHDGDGVPNSMDRQPENPRRN